MKEKWYAVHTLPQSENKAKAVIEKTSVKSGMGNKIKQIVIPVDTEVKRIQGKPVVKQTKVFPGYMLIQMEMDEETYNFDKRTPGITNFVSVGNRPVVLKDSEVQDIIDALDPNRGFKPKKKYSKNMLVRIAEGPFVDYTGKIDDVNDEKERVKVMINLFGRDTPVELDFAQVEKI